MNKRDLVLAVREGLIGATTGVAESAVDEVLGVIQAGLVKDGKVRINGFGTFEVAGRAARKGRNPQTGEGIEIPASRTVRFKPATALKECMNN